MPASRLPVNPSLEQLRKRAKELRDHVRTGHLKAVKMALELHPRWTGTSLTAGFTLADAQLVVARSHGFPAGVGSASTSTWSPGTRTIARRAVPTRSTSSCGWPA